MTTATDMGFEIGKLYRVSNDEEREFFLTEAVKAIHNKIQLEKE